MDGIPARMDEEFAGFHRDAYPGAVPLGWLLTHDHDAAEDVVQEAFARLFPRLATIEHRTGYLRTAIVNGCRDRARSAGRADAGLRHIRLVSEVSSTDRPAELLDAVAGLPYKQRAVLVLRYWADLPDEEIAEREVILGGEVTDNPDGLATVDGVSVRANENDAGSCTELVESVPYNLDGGFFNDVEAGDDIETG